jgi:hypothetical protein
MRKKSLMGLMAAAVLLLAAGQAAAAGDPGGFLGLKWSQGTADCKKQGVCSEEIITVDDQLAGETIQRGVANTYSGIPLRFSSMAFYNNKFYLGAMVFKPRSGLVANLKGSLVKEFGKPRFENPKAASWTVGNTKITLSKNETVCGLVYAHVPTWTAVAKAKNYPTGARPAPAPAPKKK